MIKKDYNYYLWTFVDRIEYGMYYRDFSEDKLKELCIMKSNNCYKNSVSYVMWV